MLARGTPVRFGIFAATAVALAACAGQVREGAVAGKPTKAKMSELNATWAGQPYKALLAAYGQPSMVMEVPQAAQKTSVVIYPVIDKMNAKCTHAFTIVHAKEPTVQNYFCQ